MTSILSDNPTDILHARPWAKIELPAEVLAVPTMLSHRERQLLYWLARFHVNGSGRIIDGGSFLGGSTAALACGLADRSDWPGAKRIAAYDRFEVEEYTLDAFGEHINDHTIGASFRDVFERHIGPWAQYVEVNAGNAMRSSWDGEPVEVLFLDMVKNWAMNDFVLKTFFPCLIPGHSVLIQQDYLWGSCPWLHITMELMKSSFTILDFMPNGSVAYLLVAPIPPNLIGTKLRSSLTRAQQFALLREATDRWTGEEHGLLELARVRLLVEYDLKSAKDEFESVRARYEHQPRVQQCASAFEKKLANDGRDWLADLLL